MTRMLAARSAIVVALLAAVAVPRGLEGQEERFQVAGSNLFSDGSAHLLYGVDQALSIGGDCQPGELCEVPEWSKAAQLKA